MVASCAGARYKNIECFGCNRSDSLMIALLRTFLAVVESGGVTQAASALNMSQAAASQQIKRLEDRLDCRLFDRVGRRLVLAPAGERLLAQAQRLVSESDDLLASMRRPAF